MQDIRAAGQLYALMLSRNTDEAWTALVKPLKDLDRIQGAPSYLLMLYLLVRREALKLNISQLSRIAQLLVCFFVRRNLTDTPPTRDLTPCSWPASTKWPTCRATPLSRSFGTNCWRYRPAMRTFRSKLEGAIYEENAGVTRFILCALAEKSMTKETWVDLWKFENKQFVWTIEQYLSSRRQHSYSLGDDDRR